MARAFRNKQIDRVDFLLRVHIDIIFRSDADRRMTEELRSDLDGHTIPAEVCAERMTVHVEAAVRDTDPFVETAEGDSFRPLVDEVPGLGREDEVCPEAVFLHLGEVPLAVEPELVHHIIAERDLAAAVFGLRWRDVVPALAAAPGEVGVLYELLIYAQHMVTDVGVFQPEEF